LLPGKVEEIRQTEAIKQPFTMERIKAQQEGMVQWHKANNETQLKIAKLMADARSSEGALNRANRLEIANLTKNLSQVPENDQNFVKLITEGILSPEDLTDQGHKPESRKRITELAISQGLVPLSRERLKELAVSKTTMAMFRDMESLTEKINSKATAGLPFTEERTEWDLLYGRLGQLAKDLGAQKGAISQLDVKAMQGYLPSLAGGIAGRLAKNNLIKIQKIRQLLQDRQKTILRGLSAEQGNRIIKNFNLLEEEE
jgi:hypothetical protein